MKKFDLYLASAMCIIALVWFLIEYIFAANGQTVNVYINNELINSYDLQIDDVYCIEYEGIIVATLSIKNGYADIISADCPDKFCVNQSKISKSGETIVCLPNKLVVKVVSNKESNKEEFDAIVY